ncbi:SRPBCC family protein [Micrococcales bacterium 31B]|nr:SRPBCC family protein [Micrococcales bacterium 31B]
MTPAPEPHGTLGEGPDGPELQIVRDIDASVEAVWAALTESSRLEEWIGRWEGDPTSGEVTFYMTAEGADAGAEQCSILECVPPRRLSLVTSVGPDSWRLRVELDATAAGTRLTFCQAVGSDPLDSIGPGWEYYLERLVRVLRGGDAKAVVWDEYFPHLSAHYAALTGA